MVIVKDMVDHIMVFSVDSQAWRRATQEEQSLIRRSMRQSEEVEFDVPPNGPHEIPENCRVIVKLQDYHGENRLHAIDDKRLLMDERGVVRRLFHNPDLCAVMARF